MRACHHYYINNNLLGPSLSYNHDEKFALAGVFSIQKLRHYILSRTTKVVANSNPMIYLLSRRVINEKYGCWIVILQEFSF